MPWLPVLEGKAPFFLFLVVIVAIAGLAFSLVNLWDLFFFFSLLPSLASSILSSATLLSLCPLYNYSLSHLGNPPEALLPPAGDPLFLLPPVEVTA